MTDDVRHGDDMLYGADGSPGLCGVAAADGGVRCWWRRDGELSAVDEQFAPFFLTSHPELLDDFKPGPEIIRLNGDNLYAWRVELETWADYDKALSHVGRAYRANRSGFEHEPFLKVGDGATQYLLATGRTHYTGLKLPAVRTLFIALRAYNSGGAEYADPAVAEDRVVLVGLAGNDGYSEQLGLEGDDETGLLSRAGQAIRDYDPDLLVGHNLFKGSLNYLLQRMKKLRVKAEWGRDGSRVTQRKSRAPAAEKQLEYPKAEIAGRNLIDTWFLAQYYDIVKRDLERFDAPYVAGYLHPGEQFADPAHSWDVDNLWDGDRPALKRDVENELAATRVVFETLSGSYFAQAQMLPLTPQDCVVRGNGMKINYLLLREYLRRGESVPAPVSGRFIVGGHTEIRRTGLIRDVLNVDMASLYPSIMLSHHVKPGTDTGDVFQPLLRALTTQRLEAKRLAREAEDPAERNLHDARQAAFKIFINSFFGYLGTNRMNWADPDRAEYITTTGQKLVKQLAGLVEDSGGSVIEIDTDGVYFTAPENMDVESEEEREALLQKLNDGLPEGITVELSGYFPAMLSHKVKNYALLGEDGEVTVKGSGMKSRGLEPYLHRFIGDSIGLILRGEAKKIAELYEGLKQDIAEGKIAIERLAKTDTLIESLDVYSQKVEAGGRNRAAAYEVALKAKRELTPGDQVSYYITGEKTTVTAFEAAKPLREYDPQEPDYNVKYYLKKLDQNLKKVKGFLPKEQQEGLFGE